MSIRYDDNKDKIEAYLKQYVKASTNLFEATEELWVDIIEPLLDEMDESIIVLEARVEDLEDEVNELEEERG